MQTPNDSIAAYWRDIQHFEPLSRQREGELFGLARQGDQQAIDELVQSNPVSYTHLTLPTKRIV